MNLADLEDFVNRCNLFNVPAALYGLIFDIIDNKIALIGIDKEEVSRIKGSNVESFSTEFITLQISYVELRLPFESLYINFSSFGKDVIEAIHVLYSYPASLDYTILKIQGLKRFSGNYVDFHSVTLLDTEYLEKGAFANSKLPILYAPNLVSMDEGCFVNCHHMQNVSFRGMTQIGVNEMSAFREMTRLRNLELAQGYMFKDEPYWELSNGTNNIYELLDISKFKVLPLSIVNMLLHSERKNLNLRNLETIYGKSEDSYRQRNSYVYVRLNNLKNLPKDFFKDLHRLTVISKSIKTVEFSAFNNVNCNMIALSDCVKLTDSSFLNNCVIKELYLPSIKELRLSSLGIKTEIQFLYVSKGTKIIEDSYYCYIEEIQYFDEADKLAFEKTYMR